MAHFYSAAAIVAVAFPLPARSLPSQPQAHRSYRDGCAIVLADFRQFHRESSILDDTFETGASVISLMAAIAVSRKIPPTSK